MDGIAKSGKWLDRSIGHRMQAAEFAGTQYYHQDPKLLRFVLSKPPDRVKYTHLSLVRKDFEEIEALGKEAGILAGYCSLRRLHRSRRSSRMRRSFSRMIGRDPRDQPSRRRSDRKKHSWSSRPPSAFVLPAAVAMVILVVWEMAVRYSNNNLFPGPWEVGLGIVELVRKGLLLKYIVASLFRVTWGFSLAVLVGVPFGLLLGWFRPHTRRLIL